MKKPAVIKLLFVFLPLAVFLTAGSLPLQNGHDLFQKALARERGEGKLEEAVALYRKVIDQTRDEALAAKAQLRIGICYEKLGREKSTSAREAFQNVIDKYPAQTDTVNLAKKKLLILQKARVSFETVDNGLRIRQLDCSLDAFNLSWDGRLLSGRDDSGNLAVIDIGTGKKWFLTKNASWDEGDFVSSAIISPHNNNVAYVWCKDGSILELKIVKIDGSGEQIIHSGRLSPTTEADYLWPYAWTAEGDYILGVQIDGQERKQVVLVSMADGSIKIIKDYKQCGPETLSLSPDGRWIAFEHKNTLKGRSYDISLLDIEGDHVFPIIQHPSNDRLLGWSPGGDSILMASDRSGSWDAWLIPLKNGKTCGEPWLVKRDFGQVSTPTGVHPLGVKKDGSLYYLSRTWGEEIHIAEMDDEGALLFPPTKIAQRFLDTNCYPTWSPDGKYLAFRSRRPNSNALCILSLDEKQHRDIFPPELLNFSRIDWSPDGKSILVVGTDRESRGGIYRVDIESGNAKPFITVRNSCHSPRYSPDGSRVFYGEDTSWKDKIFRIMKVETATGKSSEVYRSSAQIIRLDISPDGDSVAFLEPADSALKVIPAVGGQPRVVFKFREEWSTSVAWSPDGENIFFTRFPESKGKTGEIELWRIPSQGGDPVKLPLVARGMENIRFDADGERIAFNTFEVKSELWVMENFLPKKGESSRGGRK